MADPGYTRIKAPSAAVTQAVLDLWNRVRKPADVLIVIDVSGSMSTIVAGTGKSRLQLAQEASRPVVDALAPTDQLGLWAFSSPLGKDRDPWRVAVPTGPVKDVGPQFTAAVSALQADGATALYATTRAAVQSMKQQANAARISAVVLLSDGENRYDADNDLDRLLADLSAQSLDNAVRVFTIAYGSEADAKTLSSMALRTRAAAYDARNAVEIGQVVNDVLANF